MLPVWIVSLTSKEWELSHNSKRLLWSLGACQNLSQEEVHSIASLYLFRMSWLTTLKEPAWSFLGPDSKMFLQSFPDHDMLGQAFEDALEVLQQHSDREMQCPPGNKHPFSFPRSFFTGKHLLKHTGGGLIPQKWINGMFCEDEKEENFFGGFPPNHENCPVWWISSRSQHRETVGLALFTLFPAAAQVYWAHFYYSQRIYDCCATAFFQFKWF